MLKRLVGHVRGNVVAYIALMVAVVSGGGGYAIAATTHKAAKKPTSLTACVSRSSGEMFLHHGGRCAKGRHKVTWRIKGPRGKTGAAGSMGPTGATGATGAAGPAGPSAAAFADIGPVSTVSSSGLTAQHEATGAWLLTITNPACAHTTNVMVVSATGSTSPSDPPPPASSSPVVWGGGSGTQFTVTTGYTNGGSFTLFDEGFDAIIECGATLSVGQ